MSASTAGRAACRLAGVALATGALRPHGSRLVSTAAVRVHSPSDVAVSMPAVRRFVRRCDDQLRRALQGGGDGDTIAYLHRVTEAAAACETAEETCSELQQMIDGEDGELSSLAQCELDAESSRLRRLQHEMVVAAVPPDHMDTCDQVCLEVAAGAGGQEAMLFAAQLFAMYQAYAARHAWTFNVLQYDEAQLGGVSNAKAELSGERAYGRLKFESGVHRVQRVPVTERGGRLHTSTAAVILLPQPDPIVVNLRRSDVKVDYFLASGKGGMNINKNAEAVRVTHRESGVVVECQQERKARMNLSIAMKRLAATLYQQQEARQLVDFNQRRRLQAGNRSRSDRVRTYNAVQDRITDHRIKASWHRVHDEVMAGGPALDSIIDVMQASDACDRFFALLRH